jgi:murein DD-endopeptidase MepM/ murein hydrolase activator NlpD
MQHAALFESAAYELEHELGGRRMPPGGGYARPLTSGLREYESPGAPPLLLRNQAQIQHAVANNPRYASLLGWASLRDQIEVNILRVGRNTPRLSPVAFVQAVARFQRRQRLPVDGMLGPATWTRMKTMRVERDPFPRRAVTQDFDGTPAPNNCEAHIHPGIDIDVPAGTPIPVVADGIVIYAGSFGSIRSCANATACQNGTGAAKVCNFLSYGRAVIVEHPQRGPGRLSTYTIYAHVQFTNRHRVGSGEPVKAGRLIAEVGAGCVGFSSGPHLHYVVATGPRYRLTAGGPARCQVCSSAYCQAATCARCNFAHFWDVVRPQRPRTTTAAAFRW